MSRQHIASGAPWEERYGYARAVRHGAWVHVSGSTAIDEHGQLVGRDDAYAQAKQTLANIVRALEAAGSSAAAVVRTRMYVTNIQRDHDAVGRAHAEVFGAARPATAMVEVSALIAPDMLVEIEADACDDP